MRDWEGHWERLWQEHKDTFDALQEKVEKASDRGSRDLRRLEIARDQAWKELKRFEAGLEAIPNIKFKGGK